MIGFGSNLPVIISKGVLMPDKEMNIDEESTETTLTYEAKQIDASQLLSALKALDKGEFEVRLPDGQVGISGALAEVFNSIAEKNQGLSKELDRVRTIVGLEGKIKQRANLSGATGSWGACVDSVNHLITDLVQPVTEMDSIIGSVAKGDLSQVMSMEVEGVPLKGAFRKTAKTLNTMVDQLGAFAAEVTRVAREVGTEGKLGGQAKVKGVSGTWKDLTDNVNTMAKNLTDQVRNIAEVTTAVAKGDLTRAITVDAQGEILDLKQTINTMVMQLSSFASEVTRVARAVGTEGKLGDQAKVEGVSGTWKDLTDNVNTMANNLTEQVRNIAEVTTAVAGGDLTKTITVEAKGEILELRDTINTMVDQLGSFASEVTRVAREVGTEGKLGGQATVQGVSGTWKDLTDNVNTMANNLTEQVRNIAEVTTAVAGGDLAKKITVTASGEILELRTTINTMVDQLSSFASEVTRVAREVGTEGQLGGQARVEGVSGIWKDLTDNVNTMANNLTEQVRNIASVTIAVAKGDLSKTITVEAEGEILELRDTINTMVSQLGSFASEVIRVAREVGADGKLGGQATVEGVSGTWKDLTDNVNMMANNLTNQVRNIAEVTTAVANGDLAKKITVDASGEILELRTTINTMVDQLSSFASEVTRVAREVGTEGQLGGQAKVEGVSGTWKDLTDNVNTMANNLTEQVRNIADVTTAVANGDLTKKITVEASGEILELRNTINRMVSQLSSFASEVTRVAREVGTEGELGGQAKVEGVSGTWKDLTDNVNTMANNLTGQVRAIAEVTTAVARGDLTKKISVSASGEILELRNTINRMVDQLGSFASEVTRVAREVGTDGQLGGQAKVEGVSGTWKDLTDNVNMMANNLTNQVRAIAEVTTAVANGDLSKSVRVDASGEILELRNTINNMVEKLRAFGSEVTRVAREVGTEGKLGGQAAVPDVSGTWKDLTDNVNMMANNLTNQVRAIAEVTTAVANGNFSKKITVAVRGEILSLKDTINTMVDQLSSFASEVTRVAREVGTEGKLGGQAMVPGVSGTWKDLTDNVNIMGENLTNQVRGIARVVTSVANGDLKKKLTLEAKGEIAELAETINEMTNTLATFADQVTNVAREVGIEGKLGSQAMVPGAAGIWRDLTDNVNELAANLTTQVRAIAEVATAVTEGDLSRSVTADARGEVADLKDRVNEMIINLRETTRINSEQDWLKTNLARFAGMLQGQRDLLEVGNQILSELAELVNAQHGIFYIAEQSENETVLKLLASYAFQERKNLSQQFRMKEGIVGQCAYEKQRILLTHVPENYIKISSGLGEASPLNIVALPVLFEGELQAIIELASFNPFPTISLSFLDQLTENIGIMLNTIAATMRTEELLSESQSMSEELQDQQMELQQTNEELEEKAKQLEMQNTEVEQKNREVEIARIEIEEKAEQLALTSRYKSEFLANMSHELRTPLNSLLLLATTLEENRDGNLTDKQIEFASTIRGSGTELLNLINEILDLAKIESGTMDVAVDGVSFAKIREWALKNFREIALSKDLQYTVNISKSLPDKMFTDEKRLQQVLKNLLSNALKFTEAGEVTLSASVADSGWGADNLTLNNASQVVAFTVQDTGIGISAGSLNVIFEAFQQADGTTSRKYGGTGLGLSISREIAQLLGGEIRVASKQGEGSSFTFFLPLDSRSMPNRIFSTVQNVTKGSLMTQGGARMSKHAESQPFEKEAQQKGLPETDEIMLADDRNTIKEGDKTILIVEDDISFAEILLQLAREKGFKGLVAFHGETALAMAQQYLPDAISLDIRLPDMDGFQVLDRLKHIPSTRHIPVNIISAIENSMKSLHMGAVSHLTKPVTRQKIEQIFEQHNRYLERSIKELLVVEDDKKLREAIVNLIGNGDVHTQAVETGKDALDVLQSKTIDCIVLDLGLPDMTGFELIEKMEEHPEIDRIPIIVYTGKALTEKEELELKRVSETIIIKDAKSMERLLDETALFLHRIEHQLPPDKQKMLTDLYKKDPSLRGLKVMIVDDDARNIFALTNILEDYNITVLYAETGLEGIKLLKKNEDTSLVLMDIMMPEMDGYEAMRRIRKISKFKKLPIIAITAKAMKGDREKCIEAGASDYISKPVDREQLLSLIRVWTYR